MTKETNKTKNIKEVDSTEYKVPDFNFPGSRSSLRIYNNDEIIFNNGDLEITQKLMNKFTKAYPLIDVESQIAQLECLYITTPGALQQIEYLPEAVNNYLRTAHNRCM